MFRRPGHDAVCTEIIEQQTELHVIVDIIIGVILDRNAARVFRLSGLVVARSTADGIVVNQLF